MEDNERSRRARVLMWLGGIAVVLIGGLVVGHAIWSWRSGATLDRYLAQLQASGEPVTVESLEVKPIPDHLNGYSDIRAAIAALPAADDQLERSLSSAAAPPLKDDERAVLRDMTRGSEAALTALAPALKKEQVVNDQLRYPTPVFGVLLPDLSPIRRLANLANRAALLEFDAGRHDRAMHDLSLIEPLSRGAASHPFLVGALVGIGCRAMAVEQIMNFAPQLRIGTAAGEVAPAEVERWIKQLLDDGSTRSEFIRAVRSERISMLDAMQALADGNANAKQAASGVGRGLPSGYLVRPVIRQNAKFVAEHITRVIEILESKDALNWPAVKRRLEPLEKESEDRVMAWRYAFARVLLPSLDRASNTLFRAITVRRCAAVALAVRWYQVDHNGALPATLDELIPKYLPAVPMDALADGKQLNYRGGDEPMIWSVGADGKDDGGDAAPAAGSRQNKPYARSFESKDYVVPLVARPRAESAVEDGK